MKLEPKETQIIDMLFLELSQFTSAKTAKELACDIKIAQLEREHDEAIALLQELEWAYPQAGPPFCQECRRDKERGHALNCRINNFLERKIK